MVFSSTVFLFLFLPALLVLYYLPLFRSVAYRNAVLILFSIGFYAWGEPLFAPVMIATIILNWLIGIRMDSSASRAVQKRWLTLGIGVDILLLGIMKYASFISRNLAVLFRSDKLILHIVLPIGISFFTFQMMSYLFDIYYGTAHSQKNPFYVLLYICLFPQMIAGPIVRYNEIASEIDSRSENWDNLALGLRRFIYGLGKKVLIANFLAQVADNVFDHTASPSVMLAWLGAISYILQLYFDFSGYSDMAIGLGLMFGFHFPENFNYPYIAKSVTEYWRRWHISLSTWFRDYVYIPLGGNRVSRQKWLRNFFLVWLLTGIWHGANWTYLIWGLYHFVFLLLEKTIGLDHKKNKGVLSWLYTIVVVMLGLVIFRSADIRSALRYLGTMFGANAGGLVDGAFWFYLKNSAFVLALACIGSTPLVAKALAALGRRYGAVIEAAWLTLVSVLSVLQIVSSTYNPFIYFTF